MRDGILPNFFTFALWKSILFWIIPLLSFMTSTYIVAFNKDTLTYLVCWMSILLHPFVLVPLSVALDFITDCIKKCCKNTFKTRKRCNYVNTMPLYFAFVCACQYYLISRWDLIQKETLENTDLTMRGAFDLYLSFDQCCPEKQCRLSDTRPEEEQNMGYFVSVVFSRISSLMEQSSPDMSNTNSNSNVCYFLIGVIIQMITYVIIENCTNNPISISSFIIGPSKTNHESSQETKQKYEMTKNVPLMQQKSLDDDEASSHEQETFDENYPRPSPNPSKNKKSKKKLFIFQIVCCCLTSLYIVGIILSENSLKSAFVGKLLECDDGLYEDSNPGNSSINEGKFCKSKFM